MNNLIDNKLLFELPQELCAHEPPEARGLSRDGVRLLHIDRQSHKVTHSQFKQLPAFLNRSDLIVFNRSRTLPAVLVGQDAHSGTAVELRLAEHLADDSWLALLICHGLDEENTFTCGLDQGLQLKLRGGLQAEVVSRDSRIHRLWRLRFNKPYAELIALLFKFGRPVRYEHVPQGWPIDFYQNVYASEPGSAEMPSAGRAFTWRLLFDLHRRGIRSTSIILHTGLSSYLDDELDSCHPSSEEQLLIDAEAADAINRARMKGGRIIAVGTTVVRALESAADGRGFLKPMQAYTTLKIDAEHKLRCVDGLITGLHEPEASHLDMLSAFVNPKQLISAYTSAIEQGYLWHEFGDLNLIA